MSPKNWICESIPGSTPSDTWVTEDEQVWYRPYTTVLYDYLASSVSINKSNSLLSCKYVCWDGFEVQGLHCTYPVATRGIRTTYLVLDRGMWITAAPLQITSWGIHFIRNPRESHVCLSSDKYVCRLNQTQPRGSWQVWLGVLASKGVWKKPPNLRRKSDWKL